MKSIYKYFLLILLPFVLIACGEDGGGSDDPEPTFEELISGNWSMQSVTLDGTDVTSDYSGFSLTLNSNGTGTSGGSYSINNANGLLAASGTYSINGNSGIVLNGSTSVSVVLSNENKTMSFSFFNTNNIFSGGRTEAASGDYTFILIK